MDYDFEGEDVGAYPNGLSEKDFRYDVGYAKPPKHVWFKNGVSGNPRGKPIGATNKPKVLKPPLLVEMLRDAPSHGVQVMDGEDRVIVPRIVSVLSNLGEKAVAGDYRAQMFLISAVREIEMADAKKQESEFLDALKYKAKYQGTGIDGLLGGGVDKSLVPNLNHVVIDELNGTVTIIGPKNVEEHVEWLQEHE